MKTICTSYQTTQPYLTTDMPSPKHNNKMQTALTLAVEATTIVMANRVVMETDTKDKVVVMVVVAATVDVVVAEETVDVVPADAGATIILLTMILGVICPRTNARPLLRH